MDASRTRNGADMRHSFAALSRRLCSAAMTLSHQLVNELERLNSARMGKHALSRLDSRDRVRAVKDALASHHEKTPRCC